jgi:hypothetical protein
VRLFVSGQGQHEHPPLFDLLLHFWLPVAGVNPSLVRLGTTAGARVLQSPTSWTRKGGGDTGGPRPGRILALEPAGPQLVALSTEKLAAGLRTDRLIARNPTFDNDAILELVRNGRT